MSLRWIHENLEPPTCDEECSDIDDSCSEDSYDTDLSFQEDEDATDDGNGIIRDGRKKRETRRPSIATITFDENETQQNIVRKSKLRNCPPCVIWDPRLPAKNPVYNCRTIKLFCRTGYHLAITSTGRIRGLIGNNESHALLQITSVSFGVIRIQSVETRLYLAFNKKGLLYSELKTNDNTEWEQWRIGSYDAFRSHKYAHHGWWIGIKKNGRVKSGPKTSWGQKAIQFLAIQEY